MLPPNAFNCLPASFGAYKFSEATSLRVCFSSERVATNRFRRPPAWRPNQRHLGCLIRKLIEAEYRPELARNLRRRPMGRCPPSGLAIGSIKSSALNHREAVPPSEPAGWMRARSQKAGPGLDQGWQPVSRRTRVRSPLRRAKTGTSTQSVAAAEATGDFFVVKKSFPSSALIYLNIRRPNLSTSRSHCCIGKRGGGDYARSRTE